MRILSIALVAGVFLLAACDRGDAGSGGGVVDGPPVSEADLPAAMSDAICSALSRCCATAMYAYDDASCRANALDSFKVEGENSSRTSGVTYDAAAAGRCVATARMLFASCHDSPDADDALGEACSGVYVGTVAPGGACDDDAQCAPQAGKDAYCSQSGVGAGGGPSSGVCEADADPTSLEQNAHGRAGDACGATCDDEPNGDGECSAFDTSGPGGAPAASSTACYRNEGLYCDPATNACAPVGAVGAACASDDACATTAHCVAGACAPFATAGQPCDGDDDDTACPVGDASACQPAAQRCDASAYCDPSSKACVARVALGAACQSSSMCASGECGMGACVDPTAFATPGVCAGMFNDDDESDAGTRAPASWSFARRPAGARAR